MSSEILEQYMKETSRAVLAAAAGLERLNGVSSLEDAAALSAALYGAPPKPSAASVAELTSRGRLDDRNLEDEALLSISAARWGVSSSVQSLNDALEDINVATHGVSSPLGIPGQSLFAWAPEDMHVGLNRDNSPVVTPGRFTIVEPELAQNPAPGKAFKEEAEKQLGDILGLAEGDTSGHKAFVGSVADSGRLESLVCWADEFEAAVERARGGSWPDSVQSPYASEAAAAVQTISSLVASSCFKTHSQLSSPSELETFGKAATDLFRVLMADTYQKVMSCFLFHASFAVVRPRDARDDVRRRLADGGGSSRQSVKVKRRTAAETLSAVCFVLKMMPSSFVNIVFEFPRTGLGSHHGSSSTSLFPALSCIGPQFATAQDKYIQALKARRSVARRASEEGKRADYADAAVNLTGSAASLLSLLARTLLLQRTCSLVFLRKMKEYQRLWSDFSEAPPKPT
uniref:Wsv308-like protein n=1 Tax=Sicyonia whispovirus TaxID=2984283 RepID=A0A9C7EZ46_9VIRU|nr:MAG: wsv308-like protein [Sicyonia whispovirus]